MAHHLGYLVSLFSLEFLFLLTKLREIELHDILNQILKLSLILFKLSDVDNVLLFKVR